MQKLVFTLLLIISGLVCGYLLQSLIRHRVKNYNILLPRLRKSLQKISMLGIIPLTFVGVVWIIPFTDMRIVLLPFLGAGLLLLGGGFGLITASLFGYQGAQKSVLFCSGFFTNIGSFGGLISFVLFGEQGFALLSLYKIFEEILYYSVGFPIARYFATETTDSDLKQKILSFFKDPFLVMATGSFLCGLILNLTKIPRPPVYEQFNGIFVPLGIFLILVSVGLGIRFSSVRQYLAEGMAISLIKFILLPSIGGTVAYLLGFADIMDGLPLKIVLIASSMPVAFNALLVASIYDLDLDMANSCWIITTSGLVLVLPVLSVLFTFL